MELSLEYITMKILKNTCIDNFDILANNHYSSFICDILLKLSDMRDKKILIKHHSKSNSINSLYNNNTRKIIINILKNGLIKEKKNFKKSNKNMFEKKIIIKKIIELKLKEVVKRMFKNYFICYIYLFFIPYFQ